MADAYGMELSKIREDISASELTFSFSEGKVYVSLKKFYEDDYNYDSMEPCSAPDHIITALSEPFVLSEQISIGALKFLKENIVEIIQEAEERESNYEADRGDYHSNNDFSEPDYNDLLDDHLKTYYMDNPDARG